MAESLMDHFDRSVFFSNLAIHYDSSIRLGQCIKPVVGCFAKEKVVAVKS